MLPTCVSGPKLNKTRMRNTVRFIVVTQDETFADDVRALLMQRDGAKIVAEVDEPALMAQAVQQFPVDVVLVDLDPTPEQVLPILSEAAQAHRGVDMFAVSASTDGPLILKAMRTGIKEFLPKPIDAKAFEEAVDRVAAERGESLQQGTLITVIGACGGVGSTLLATSLAVELAQLAAGQVTVVDLDYRFGQVATLLDVDPTYTIADLCASPEQLEAQVIARAMNSHPSGVQVLSRPEHLTEADTITAASCMGVFSNLVQLNEFVVADGPTRFDVGGRSVLALSDVILLVVEPLVPCVRNAVRLLQNLREGGINLDRVRLVCNRVGRGASHLSVEDVTGTVGLEAFGCVPNDWETANAAINLGEPLFTHSPKSKLRIALQEIAQRLHTPGNESDEKEGRKQGLIGRIFAGG